MADQGKDAHNKETTRAWYTADMASRLEWVRNNKVLVAGLATAFVAVVWIANEGKAAAPATTRQVTAPATASSTEATSEFKNTMGIAEQAGLVSSYAFSDTERVIYVTDLW